MLLVSAKIWAFQYGLRIRLVVVATQKFVAEVASDALQYATELFDYKLRPVGLPTPKKHIKSVSPSALSSRASLSKQLYKNPGVLIETTPTLPGMIGFWLPRLRSWLRNHELKVPFNLEKFTALASRGVIEAMVRGFIRGGSLHLARKVLLIAKHGKRMLDSSVYAKLILELGKNPDKQLLVVALLDELGERDDFNLSQQDCIAIAIMKVCIRL
uniref:Uncharacterized protein n=1 Tax=Fagus sylvatica TaxID=28930 RepID=A0A2N9ES50_FAGSY